MSSRFADDLIKALEAQGCRIRWTKGGAFIYCPDGVTTIGIHISKPSDMRTLKNLKASVLRAGLEWPEKIRN